MTRDEELAALRVKLERSRGMDGYADRVKAIQARIDDLERNADD